MTRNEKYLATKDMLSTIYGMVVIAVIGEGVK